MKKIILIMGLIILSIPRSISALTYSDFIVESTSTSQMEINLFDYWVVEGEDKTDPANKENFGINRNSLLIFLTSTTGAAKNYGKWNSWDSSHPWVPVTGIVAPFLNENGYPVLNISEEDISAAPKLKDRTNTSLEYLFNPDVEEEYRKAYENVTGLFQHSAERGDYYSSFENFAQFDESTNSFILYDSPAINGFRSLGQFFPFNTADQLFTIDEEKQTLKINSVGTQSPILNHYMGMSITSQFGQPLNGQVFNSDTSTYRDMVFTFTGDDDIWIYIDGVLVADVGGIHNAIKTEINFASGQVMIVPNEASQISDKTKKSYFLGDVYEGINDKYTDEYMSQNFVKEFDENGNITKYSFKEDTVHTLQIFYLERGNSDSNLQVSFWPTVNGVLPEEEPEIDPEEPEIDPEEPEIDPEEPEIDSEEPEIDSEEPEIDSDKSDDIIYDNGSIENPKTGDTILNLIFICIFSFIGMYYIFNKIKQKKIKL